ncbi:GTPase HflX [Candidatus Neomarinimicrobiota bacterium]
MYIIHQDEEIHRERTLLVGVEWPTVTSQTVRDHLDELAQLTDTAGGVIVGEVIQKRQRPEAATFIGKGKVESLVAQAIALKCHFIIFDDDLTPSQQKNLQQIAGDDISIMDRSALILNIFSQHAQTREAKTQVELAQMEYNLPRLAGLWTHLERQRGATGTRGGPGESQIEVDRRITRTRIAQLKKELKKITKERFTQRQKRAGAFRVALAGYTNTGKSTLLNAMTGASVYIEDQLFATLDTTTRKMTLAHHAPILLSDTVGFIRKLPHHLVASFRSTLAEIAEADLILKVLDISSPHINEHHATISEVLHEMGIDDKPSLLVLNKMDLLEDTGRIQAIRRQFPEAIIISARRKLKLDDLESAILKVYNQDFREAVLRVTPQQSRLVHTIYQAVEVEHQTYDGDTAVFTVRGRESILRSLQDQISQMDKS